MSGEAEREADRVKVLLVDDEPQVLQGLKLFLRRGYDVLTAESGPAGLELIEQHADVGVIVSDMRMPEMTGAEFLRRSIELAPEATRVLLTGQTDLESAIVAVNEGRIYRFLSKPCGKEQFCATIAEAARLYQAHSAERDLLERTVRGAVLMLTEVLGLVKPTALKYSEQITAVVRQVCEELKIELDWRIELSAMLSHVGCVTLSEELLERAYGSEMLGASDVEALCEQRALASELIGSIPRLGPVSTILQASRKGASSDATAGPIASWDPMVLGGELLRMATAYLREVGLQPDEGKAKIRIAESGNFCVPLLKGLARVKVAKSGREVLSVDCNLLRVGMELAGPIQTLDGVPIASAGARVSETMLRFVHRYAERNQIKQPLLVFKEGLEGSGSSKAA